MDVRKIVSKDLETRVSWMNNPKVYKSMHFKIPITIEETIEWYRRNSTNNCRVDVSIVEQDDTIVAMGGLTHIDFELMKAELYIFVSPEKQGMGYGTYSTALLCNYGFEVLGLHKVYLYTNATNIAAAHIYEKVGFVLEGTLREEVIEENDYSDRLYYGLLKSEFNMDKLISNHVFRKEVGGGEIGNNR